MNLSPSAFDAMVEGFVRIAARDRAPECFDELVTLLPGVYPTDVLAALERLGRRDEVDAITLARLRRRCLQCEPPAIGSNPLPVPHPLDFDWRFSPDAVDRLVHECRSRQDGARPLLLGAPSVFWALRSVEGVPALLLDANPSVINAVGGSGGPGDARVCDLLSDELPPDRSAVLVVDPPWYREHERVFLWAAARLCQPGGCVLVSVPGEGTRPGVAADREDALAWAAQLGFDVETVEPGALGYLSPPFERNALAAVGLGGLPNVWRHGDLLVLRLGRHRQVPRPSFEVESRWPEVVIGSVRLRIRSTEGGYSGGVIDPRLRGLLPGDVLDSVSRRDPRRERVVIWTTGNRVFGSRSPEALLEVVRSQAEGSDPQVRIERVLGRRLTPAERRNIRSSMAQVSAVADAERAELVAMGWAA